MQIVADSSVDALVLSLGELRVFLDRGMFSGRTRNALVDSVGTNVPCDTKVKCNLAYMERWNRQKSTIVRALVRGHRHPPECRLATTRKPSSRNPPSRAPAPPILPPAPPAELLPSSTLRARCSKTKTGARPSGGNAGVPCRTVGRRG